METRLIVREDKGEFSIGQSDMAVSDRIKEAIDKINLADPVNALIQACIAVDATAQKEYPRSALGERIKRFLRNNQVFLTAYLRLSVGGDILFRFKGNNGGAETKKLEEVLYKLVRCALVHEAELSERVTITTERAFGFSKDGKFLLSIGLIWGMIHSVISSHVNSQERAPGDYWISFRGQKLLLNELWGKKDVILNLAGVTPG